MVQERWEQWDHSLMLQQLGSIENARGQRRRQTLAAQQGIPLMTKANRGGWKTCTRVPHAP